jgi:hypothetical protein
MDVRSRDELVDPPAAAAPLLERHAVLSRVPTGAALAALRLSEEARGVRGLDVLRRSVDRAPPVPA